MEKVRIIVSTHIQNEFVRTEYPYLPLFAGKALSPDVDLGYTNDNEGDNISEKNRQYCELTALYWGWRNLKDVQYAGLAHGTRYLDLEVNDSSIDKLMSGVDMYVSETILCTGLLVDALVGLTTNEDFLIFLDTLLKLHPEYRKSALEYFFNSRELVRCNIFLARKELYDKYCETFFPVFFECEKRLRKHPFSRQNRDIAYFGEFCLGLFILHEKLKVKKTFLVESGRGVDSIGRLSRLRWMLIKRMKSMMYDAINPHYKDFPVFWPAIKALEKDGVTIDFFNPIRP